MKKSVPTLDLAEQKILHILKPIVGQMTGPNPRITWYASAQLPDNFTIKVQVLSTDEKGKRKEIHLFDVKNTGEFLIPTPLEDGEYEIRLLGIDQEGIKKTSRYHRITVDPVRAYRKRINCPAAWSFLFMGPIRANPCCNLKAGAGFPYNPEQSTIDPWNSPGMIALRESLLEGRADFCHPGCPVLRKKHATPDAAFLEYARQNRTSPNTEMAFLDGSNRRAFQRGEVVVDNPQTLKIAMGSKCNHACTFCKAIQREWKQNDSIFNNIAVKFAPNVKRLMLTGGEPLAYWKSFISHMRKNNIDISDMILSMISNGALLGTFASDLSKFKELQIFISLNAATPESYLRVHRVDDFQKVKEGIHKLREMRGDKPTMIRLKMVYMRSTFREIPLYADLAQELGADRVAFTNMTYFRQADALPTEALSIRDPEWPEAHRLLNETTAKLTRLGISNSVRIPGQKRVDPADALAAEMWDEDA